jgi:hypothetical protein
LGSGSEEDLLDGVVKAPAQLAQELAIVLETEAQGMVTTYWRMGTSPKTSSSTCSAKSRAGTESVTFS